MSVEMSIWLAVSGLVVGSIITLLVSRHYHKLSDKKRIPTFLIESTKQLMRPEVVALDGVTVQFNGKNIGGKGIAEAKVYFWNSGTLAIRTEDVLTPYTIVLPGKLLTYSVMKSSREVAKVSLTNDHPSGASLGINFEILEPGDATLVWMTYLGSANLSEIEFSGACVGSKRPKTMPQDLIYLLPRPRRGLQVFLKVLSALSPPMVFIAIWALFKWVIRPLAGTRAADAIIAIFVVIMLLLIVFAIGFVVWYNAKRVMSPSTPPDIKT